MATVLSNDSERWPCVTASGAGCVLIVAVVPNAKRSEVIGLHDGALRVRLAAPAIEGRANDELVAWLSRELRLPRRGIALLQGQTSRRKRLALDIDAQAVAAWLERVA